MGWFARRQTVLPPEEHGSPFLAGACYRVRENGSDFAAERWHSTRAVGPALARSSGHALRSNAKCGEILEYRKSIYALREDYTLYIFRDKAGNVVRLEVDDFWRYEVPRYPPFLGTQFVFVEPRPEGYLPEPGDWPEPGREGWLVTLLLRIMQGSAAAIADGNWPSLEAVH